MIQEKTEKQKKVVQRYLIIVGLVLVFAGLLWPWLKNIPLGSLPGDIVIVRKNFRMYFPLTTSIVLSLLLTFLFWLFRK